MHALALLALLSLALLALPASANQSVGAGPVAVSTASTDAGPCDDGNGYQVRRADASATLTEHQRFEVRMVSYCSAFECDEYSSQSGGLGVMAGRCGDWGCGPYVSNDWWYFAESYGGSGYHACTGTLYLTGIGVNLGCPSPDGSPPPLLPPL